MAGRFLHRRFLDIEDEAFDMTPVIDVVFLLIIFFMLVCQFIVAERFRVQVPEDIVSAGKSQDDDRILTLVVVPQDKGVVYAVDNERLDVANAADLSAVIAAAIDEHFRTADPQQPRIVWLRCDKSAFFGDVRPVLEGIARSRATHVDWAVRGKE
ncbi:MAG: biopolymer transporter ExbD [Planctomycetes bacterium]|nr:biopolymer transporter ExbD [Planctomycetota bacterium]